VHRKSTFVLIMVDSYVLLFLVSSKDGECQGRFAFYRTHDDIMLRRRSLLTSQRTEAGDAWACGRLPSNAFCSKERIPSRVTGRGL